MVAYGRSALAAPGRRAGATSIRATNELRAGTRSDHGRVDALFARLDLSQGEPYRMFLEAMAAAHIPVEEALDRAGAAAILPDWPARRRGDRLARDLAELHASPGEPVPAPPFPGIPEVLGGLYVLEGSRLGGAVLKRTLAPGLPARFLDAPAAPGSWRTLLATIDARLHRGEEIAAALEAARAVFRAFEAAGARFAETSARV